MVVDTNPGQQLATPTHFATEVVTVVVVATETTDVEQNNVPVAKPLSAST